MKYPLWLKKLVLPFEFPDHPLYYDKAAIEAAKAEEDALWDELFGPGAPPLIVHTKEEEED